MNNKAEYTMNNDIGDNELPSPVDVEYTPAPRITRLFNFIIDFMAMTVFMVVLLITFDLIGLGFISKFVSEMPEILAGLTLYLIYYIPFEALTGRTPGKYITGTKVITIDGEECGLYHAIGRAFLRNIPFDALSIFRKSSLCWHDSLAKTIVIKCR